MADIHRDPNYRVVRAPGEAAAYLLGMGPTPPPQPQDVAVAVVHHLLDNADAAVLAAADENLDPVRRSDRVVVRVPTEDKTTRDIDFPADVPRFDFRDRIIAAMEVDAFSVKLGWKTSDEKQRTLPHQLKTDADADQAIKTILDIQRNPRRKRAIVLEIIHLNPEPAPRKKRNENGYVEELRVIKQRLKCIRHPGANRWCYVRPNNPDEHIALGLEEIMLWARKIHDNEADIDCAQPPNCLAIDPLHERQPHSIRHPQTKAPEIPPIHINIAGHALGNSSRHNIPVTNPNARALKRSRSLTDTSDADSDSDEEEALPLSEVLLTLHPKYPKLDLLQYIPLFEKEKFFYAETILQFDRDYLAQLGIAEGAIYPLMSGVEKILHREEKQRKRARLFREQSLEI